MKTIKISDEVWNAIASKGKFGETEDDVLRRVFMIDPLSPVPNSGARKNRITAGRRQNYATNKMSSYVSQDRLIVEFATGERKEWSLPDKSDKAEIKKIRSEAGTFAKTVGATVGQKNAVYKALTEEGYHISR